MTNESETMSNPQACPGISVEGHLIPEAREHCRGCRVAVTLVPELRALCEEWKEEATNLGALSRRRMEMCEKELRALLADLPDAPKKGKL